MLFETPELIYNRLFEIIENDSTFDYCKLKQRGFHPRDPNLLSPTMYPWIFIEYVSQTGIEPYRMPRVWTYEQTIGIVCMSLADRADFDSVVFRETDSKNVNPGVGNMVADVQKVLWTHHEDFGIAGDTLLKWNISRIGTPSVLQVQMLLMSEFVRGLQIDLVYQIVESE